MLELKLVGDITGRFFVARYQRGFRWGRDEVKRLLDDIWNSNGDSYNLQPVVVKRRDKDSWELVDGQQRLTTLYLIFRYMQRENLQNADPTYSITYETRPGSAVFLKDPDVAQSEKNIDFFYLYAAYDCIRDWFEKYGYRRQHVANKLYGYLFESVRVIWYEAPHDMDSATLFTRLNVGRIPLTDAELVKALLLSRSLGGVTQTDRVREIAAQWDVVERDLHNPDIWAFVAKAKEDEYSTPRITLLLDTLAGGTQGRNRPRYYTFERLQEEIKPPGSPEAVWNRVLDLHALVLGWFDNRDLYHKIGYLVAVDQRFDELVAFAAGRTKSSFEELLDEKIRETLDLTPSTVTELSYETDAHKKKCKDLLLLMNVETVRRVEHSTERYPFQRHASEEWSLEHIHAQQADSLSTMEQWKEWMRLHREVLTEFPAVDKKRRDELVMRIDAVGEQVDRQIFQEIARAVNEIFTSADATGPETIHSVHSVTNLALLSTGVNSALSNSVFEVKRRNILDFDRRGKYIPICTRQVFLKYYTDPNAQQIHFWGRQDRESYLEAMISPDKGVIFKYLRPEEPQA